MAETLAVSMVVAEMPSAQNHLMTTLEKETLEVVGSIMVRPLNNTLEKETLEVVGSIVASRFYHFHSG